MDAVHPELAFLRRQANKYYLLLLKLQFDPFGSFNDINWKRFSWPGMAQIVGIFQSLFYSVGIKLNESVCASLVMNHFHHIKIFRLCYVLIVCGSVAATNILG